MLNNIEKTEEGYVVEIVEYIENYSSEESVIIKNLNGEEIGRVGIDDTETKMQEIVKSHLDRFDKKKVYLKSEQDRKISSNQNRKSSTIGTKIK